jgi:hypothetical protein
VSGYQEHFDFRMALNFVGEGMGVKHNSAQNFLAAVYDLSHDFPGLFSGDRDGEPRLLEPPFH